MAPHLHHTPLLSSRSLAERIGAPAYLKAESLQRTGCFKVRGALAAVAALSEAERAAGVVSMSAGNFAMALAYAARQARTRVTVVMPAAAPAAKVEATRAYGGQVVLHPDRVSLPERLADEQRRSGAVVIPPYDDRRIMAGHGTLALEVVEDLPEATLIVVPVGGGGLIGGIAAALAERRPRVRVVGVEPEGAAAMRRALDAGSPQRLERIDTVADGLTAPYAGELCHQIVRALVDDVVVISDEAILEGLRFLAARAKLVVEPAGAAAVGALLAGAVPVRRDDRVVAVLSGGNVDPDGFATFLAGPQ